MKEPFWKCIDPVLCSYEITIKGRKYLAQRTWTDNVAVWLAGERLTYCHDLGKALIFVLDHAK